MSQTVKCTLCPPDTWLAVEGLVDHMEAEHAAEHNFARWPDGKIVVFNEDQLDEV